MEQLFMQIFERRDWIKSQIRQQGDSYAQSVAYNYLAEAIRRPDYSQNSHLFPELEKHPMFSHNIYNLPRYATPINHSLYNFYPTRQNINAFTLGKSVAKEINLNLHHGKRESFAQKKGEGSIVMDSLDGIQGSIQELGKRKVKARDLKKMDNALSKRQKSMAEYSGRMTRSRAASAKNLNHRDRREEVTFVGLAGSKGQISLNLQKDEIEEQMALKEEKIKLIPREKYSMAEREREKNMIPTMSQSGIEENFTKIYVPRELKSTGSVDRQREVFTDAISSALVDRNQTLKELNEANLIGKEATCPNLLPNIGNPVLVRFTDFTEKSSDQVLHDGEDAEDDPKFKRSPRISDFEAETLSAMEPDFPNFVNSVLVGSADLPEKSSDQVLHAHEDAEDLPVIRNWPRNSDFEAEDSEMESDIPKIINSVSVGSADLPEKSIYQVLQVHEDAQDLPDFESDARISNIKAETLSVMDSDTKNHVNSVMIESKDILAKSSDEVFQDHENPEDQPGNVNSSRNSDWEPEIPSVSKSGIKDIPEKSFVQVFPGNKDFEELPDVAAAARNSVVEAENSSAINLIALEKEIDAVEESRSHVEVDEREVVAVEESLSHVEVEERVVAVEESLSHLEVEEREVDAVEESLSHLEVEEREVDAAEESLSHLEVQEREVDADEESLSYLEVQEREVDADQNSLSNLEVEEREADADEESLGHLEVQEREFEADEESLSHLEVQERESEADEDSLSVHDDQCALAVESVALEKEFGDDEDSLSSRNVQMTTDSEKKIIFQRNTSPNMDDLIIEKHILVPELVFDDPNLQKLSRERARVLEQLQKSMNNHGVFSADKLGKRSSTGNEPSFSSHDSLESGNVISDQEIQKNIETCRSSGEFLNCIGIDDQSLSYEGKENNLKTLKLPFTPPAEKFLQKSFLERKGFGFAQLGSSLSCFPIQENSRFLKGKFSNAGDFSTRREPLLDVTLMHLNSSSRDQALKCKPDSRFLRSANKTEDLKKNPDKLSEISSQREQIGDVIPINLSSSSEIEKSEKKLFGRGLQSAKKNLNAKHEERKTSQVIPEKKYKNITSNIQSFVPLVRQKQPALAPTTGKRDVKVKALEAAEAAKRLAEKKENERKMKKEAMKLERVKIEKENARKLEEKQKQKEEERKKKEAAMAAKKRQREEEMREKQKKKYCPDLVRQQKKEELTKECRVSPSSEELASQDHDAAKNMENKPDEPNTLQAMEEQRVRCSASLLQMAMQENRRSQSYEISPYRDSDDEEADNKRYKKKLIPSWARRESLDAVLLSMRQMDPTKIFARKSSFDLAKVLPNRTRQLLH